MRRRSSSHSPGLDQPAFFPVWGNSSWISPLPPRVVCENVCFRLSSCHAHKELVCPSPVISSQSTGPDAPDPVNEMLRDLAIEGFRFQGDTTPPLTQLRARVSRQQTLGRGNGAKPNHQFGISLGNLCDEGSERQVGKWAFIRSLVSAELSARTRRRWPRLAKEIRCISALQEPIVEK